ncbi:hypothetical protein IWX46DRAFT_604869 [Phyllosticta citricarpa]|uniref:Secreted protein n=1 Tax=Phyllosticta citricarpa TaxID=55181 RepID=A0ABR1M2M3_9PEZI
MTCCARARHASARPWSHSLVLALSALSAAKQFLFPVPLESQEPRLHGHPARSRTRFRIGPALYSRKATYHASCQRGSSSRAKIFMVSKLLVPLRSLL